jgi:hypothetical protein
MANGKEFKMRELKKSDHDKHRYCELKMAQLKVQTEPGLPSDSKVAPHFRVDSVAKLLPTLVSEQKLKLFLQTQLKGKGSKVLSESFTSSAASTR